MWFTSESAIKTAIEDAARKRYAQDCENDGITYNEPADVEVGEKYVTLSNVNGVITRYEHKVHIQLFPSRRD